VGRLQPRLSMGSQNLYRAQTRGATPSATTETPMPPDQVACLPEASGIFHHGLSVRCVLGNGLTTYWTVPYLWQGQVVVWNKYGGYWNKTRSTADSGGLSIPCMISIPNIFQPTDRITTPHTSSCPTGHNHLDEEPKISSCLPKTETFSAFQ